jgi:hypothetical protein
MKKFKILAFLAVLLSVMSFVYADLGDIWALPGNVWRVTSSGHLIPGTTNVSELGSSSKMVKTLYATDQVFSSTTVTANATLTSNPSSILIGSISGDRTYTLAAPVAGHEVWIQDVAGNVSVNGNVTIAAGSGRTINGASSITIEGAYNGVRLIGLTSTTWAASKTTTPDTP